MAFVAVYDANVLHPSVLRDVLIRVAAAGLVQAKWTETILDETFRNLKANRPDLDTDKLDRTRNAMKGRFGIVWSSGTSRSSMRYSCLTPMIGTCWRRRYAPRLR